MTAQTTRDSITNLDGQMLKAFLLAGLAWLEKHYQIVNQLNVFPVPDGDTGINMLLTMQSAYAEIAENDDQHAGNIARRFARGAVNGSRGNSGVILSQIWRGFSDALRDTSTIDAAAFVAAARKGVEFAYDAAPKPAREGTILTVARESAEKLEELGESASDLIMLVEFMVEQAKDTLRRTPDMLDVLKQAGVVDSGGQGFVFIWEGILRKMRGESMDEAIEQSAAAVPARKQAPVMSAVEFGHPYDVQLILSGRSLDVDNIRAAIDAMGDSGIVAADDQGNIKIHVHVYDPGQPISYAANLGVVGDVVVENMYQQYLENVGAGEDMLGQAQPHPTVELEPDDVAVIAVVPGDGLAQIFYEQGTARIISGGQTMNPSTEDIFKAINELPTSKVIILPNNKNIILAAQQAAKKARKKSVAIVESRSIPQGISAMLAYANARLNQTQRKDLDFIAEAMREHLDHVRSGEITRAVRSIELNGVRAQIGDLIALLDDELAASGNEILAIFSTLVQRLDPAEYELLTLYHGADVSTAEAQALAEALGEQFNDFEFEVIPGGQPHYYYLLSIE